MLHPKKYTNAPQGVDWDEFMQALGRTNVVACMEMAFLSSRLVKEADIISQKHGHYPEVSLLGIWADTVELPAQPESTLPAATRGGAENDKLRLEEVVRRCTRKVEEAQRNMSVWRSCSEPPCHRRLPQWSLIDSGLQWDMCASGSDSRVAFRGSRVATRGGPSRARCLGHVSQWLNLHQCKGETKKQKTERKDKEGSV